MIRCLNNFGGGGRKCLEENKEMGWGVKKGGGIIC